MTDQRADIDYSAVKNLPELLDVLSRNGASFFGRVYKPGEGRRKAAETVA